LDDQNTIAHGYWERMPREEVSHDFAPCDLNLLFVEAFRQAELVEELFQRIPRGNATLRAHRFFWQATPILQNSPADFGDAHQQKGLRTRGGVDERSCGEAKLFAVVSDCLYWAAFHCLFAKSFFFRSLGLLIDETVAAIVVAREIRWRCLTAKVAVDALIVHEESANDILRIFVCYVCHRYFLLRCRKLRSHLRNAIVF
jgi:hypothetical protein